MEVMKQIQLLEHFASDEIVRPDGRKFTDMRPVTLNLGSITTANGSALVKLGNTTVMCGVKAELAEPRDESPEKGYVIPNVDLPPLCSAKFKPGPPPELAQVANQFMDELISASKCINTANLCISAGKLVWSLYCDMVCLDFDGNLFDACTIALVASLKNTSLPVVSIDEQTGQVKVDMEKSEPLTLDSIPVCTTFTFIPPAKVLLDASLDEESVGEGHYSVVSTATDDICLVHQPGGCGMSQAQLQDCMQISFKQAAKIRSLIEEVALQVER